MRLDYKTIWPRLFSTLFRELTALCAIILVLMFLFSRDTAQIFIAGFLVLLLIYGVLADLLDEVRK